MNNLKAFLPYLFGNKVGKPLVFKLPEKEKWNDLSFEEQLCFHALCHSLDDFLNTLEWSRLTPKDIFHTINFLPFVSAKNAQKITQYFALELQFFKEAKSDAVLCASSVQNLLDFKNQKLSVFALIPSDRSRPGRLLIRKSDGTFLKNQDQDIWSIPVLAHTHRGLSFNHSNGHTPCGVYTIDGVMPKPDRPRDFGEYRRLIVNFLNPQSEHDYLNLVPSDHHSLHWWKQSKLAYLLGRSLLRIHGTGLKNYNIFSSYYPFVPTSGCLATIEIEGIGVHKKHHQRDLLNALMRAQGLDENYENEAKIHGLLYVVEFNDSLSALEFKV